MNVELQDVMERQGYLAPNALVAELHITKKEFASAIGLRHDAIIRRDRLTSVATQQRLRQATEILKRIEPWAGSLSVAWSWYRSYPIAPLGGLTAEDLLSQGRADEVREYLSHIAEDGYA
ncbi:XRE family transcriptional regulator [Halomonas sp. Bachu 37]|uniref:XRE family transcriptional regulator n=1 Tax=Halomonas kashgarensis TaxID=3084920 RepID=UPI003217279F